MKPITQQEITDGEIVAKSQNCGITSERLNEFSAQIYHQRMLSLLMVAAMEKIESQIRGTT